jgi:hypothetical protein
MSSPHQETADLKLLKQRQQSSNGHYPDAPNQYRISDVGMRRRRMMSRRFRKTPGSRRSSSGYTRYIERSRSSAWPCRSSSHPAIHGGRRIARR